MSRILAGGVNLLWDKTFYYRKIVLDSGLVPAQDGLFALILWYVAKTLFRIVGIGPIPVKEI